MAEKKETAKKETKKVAEQTAPKKETKKEPLWVVMPAK